MAISQRIVIKISGAVDNIVEHGILKYQNNKFNGVEVLQVLAMSGMAFSKYRYNGHILCPEVFATKYKNCRINNRKLRL